MKFNNHILLLCVLVAFTGVALAASSQPVPRPPKNDHVQKNHAQNETVKAEVNQRGTKNEPIFVQVVEPDTTASAPSKQLEQRNETPSGNKAIDYLIAAIGAAATVVIAGFTITLSRSTKRLWQEAEKASAIAKITADAAHISAESVKQAERAYVTTNVIKPGVVWGNDEGHIEVRIGIKNNGRTPAVVSDVMLDCCVLENGAALVERSMPVSETARSAFLVPGDSLPWNRNLRIAEDTLNRVKNGSKTLWIYGYVDYFDVFKRRHRYGFARIYLPALEGSNLNIVRPTERGVWRDYDRERNQGEGNDWVE